jgi:hypothetical protein
MSLHWTVQIRLASREFDLPETLLWCRGASLLAVYDHNIERIRALAMRAGPLSGESCQTPAGTHAEGGCSPTCDATMA